MRKALGIVMLAIGISGIALSIAGLIAGRRLVATIGIGLQTNLTMTLDSLGTVKETLILTKLTVSQMNGSLDTVEDTANNVSVAIDNTRPLLQQASTVTTEDVPESIEAFQATLPALIDVAAAVDDTLTTLNAFNVDRTILGIPLSFDLGIEYNPEVPFDESVKQVGESLDGLPQEMRSLKQHIDVTERNLHIISRNISDIADDLSVINNNIAQLEPLIDDYIETVTALSDSTRQSRDLVEQQMTQMKLTITIVMIWFGLTQIAPIYLGWELLAGNRNGELVEK